MWLGYEQCLYNAIHTNFLQTTDCSALLMGNNPSDTWRDVSSKVTWGAPQWLINKLNVSLNWDRLIDFVCMYTCPRETQKRMCTKTDITFNSHALIWKNNNNNNNNKLGVQTWVAERVCRVQIKIDSTTSWMSNAQMSWNIICKCFTFPCYNFLVPSRLPIFASFSESFHPLKT